MPNDPPSRLTHPDGSGERLAVGARVGGARYILRRVLGRGIAGPVWLAWDVKIEQEVALKFMPESLLRDPQGLEAMRTQTQRNAELVHPHIARTYDFIHDHQLAAIVLEYVEGWSLAALKVDKPHGRYAYEELAFWVRQLCAALAYAHTELGLLHLGLRPANLMINAREELKVTDFGIACRLHNLAAAAGTMAPAELAFLSPQQALGEPPSVQDDIYSFGATLYDLLTGTPPFYQGDLLEQLRETTPPSIAERLSELRIKGSVPQVVEDAVALCLAKDPAERPPTISHALQLLERSEVLMPDEEAAEPADETAEPSPAQPSQAAREDTPPDTPVAPPDAPVTPASRQAPAAMQPDVPQAETGAAVAEETAPETLPVRMSRPGWILLGAVLVTLGVVGLLWAMVVRQRQPAVPPVLAGAVDVSFKPPTNANHEIRVALERPDGKLLVAGMFTQFGEQTHRGIARLNPDGSEDPSFAATIDGDVYALTSQPDGAIIVGGLFTRVNGQPCRRIARLTSDGSVDEDFAANAGVNGAIRAAAVQADGKILVAGNFTAAGGRKQPRIARFKADGRRDGTFRPGTGPSAIVWALALQPDGKILAAGDFTTFNSQPCNRLVRLNPDGSLDAAFDIGVGANATVYTVLVQSDGRILIGGDFTVVNSTDRNRIARLDPDGAVDPTFTPAEGPNGGVRCLAVERDGRILIGGIFTSVGGQPRNRIARLNASGLLDRTFDPREGAEEVVRAMVPQADGKILVVGRFKTFGGIERIHITRLAAGGRK